jgi:hypothetical protein
MLWKSRTVSGASSTNKDDFLIKADASGGGFTITLIAAASFTDRFLVIKKIAGNPANVVTVDGNGAETIDGAATQLLILANSSLTLYSDGTQWWII